MKKSKLFLGLATLAIAATIVTTSCRKEKKENDSDVAAATDHNYAENVVSDISNIGDQAANTTTGNALSTYKNGTGLDNTFAISCADSIKRDTINKIIIVDFGTTPKICQDGRARSGKLKFTYTGGTHYRDFGVTITVTPINYTVDGNGISGTKTIKNLGLVNGNLAWTVTANIQIAKVNGGTISWSCNRTKELKNTSAVYVNQTTPINWLQAIIGVTGSANGTTSGGDNFTATITTQLVRDFSCSPDPSMPHRHPFISGAIDFTPGTKATRHIDFGAGTCDLDASVKINDITFPIKLK